MAASVGAVWAAGFLWFWATRRIPAGWTPRLLTVGALGGLQGALGWWMVRSGLGQGMVDVASYRLALHLGLAFVILGLLAWFILSLARSEPVLLQARRQGEPRLAGMATGMMHFAFLQILLGALVAGIDAGRAFPTWPLMGDSFFPADAFHVPDGGATWRAFFENPGLVQFMHRMAGYLLAAFGLALWLRSRRSAHPDTRAAFSVMGIDARHPDRPRNRDCSSRRPSASWSHSPDRCRPALGPDPARTAPRPLSARHFSQRQIMTAFQNLMAFQRETEALAQIAGRLGWDQETMMPPGAAHQRGEEMSAIEGVLHSPAAPTRASATGWQGQRRRMRQASARWT